MDKNNIRHLVDIKVPQSVSNWLLVGVVMVFFQIVLGGITRLTGSGLSITEWAPIMGVMPPLSVEAWEHAFDLYKATPQYLKINPDMTLGGFKYIFFWEWFHRLWARTMFFIFLVGFFYFLYKKCMPAKLRRHLLVIVGLGALEGLFGWIMVASGLKDRPWVNAYKLTVHLSIGLLIFSYLFVTYIKTLPLWVSVIHKNVNNRWLKLMIGITFLQIMLGGLMSGMKAGLAYPTWPLQGSSLLPDVLLDSSAWNYTNVDVYDGHAFMPAIVQFLHRNVAYALTIMLLCIIVSLLNKKLRKSYKRSLHFVLFLLCSQILLGIFTLINCKGNVPILLAAAHQACAVLLFGSILYVNYRNNRHAY